MKKLRGAAIPPSSLNNSESEEERTEEVSARACVYCARISLWGTYWDSLASTHLLEVIFKGIPPRVFRFHPWIRKKRLGNVVAVLICVCVISTLGIEDILASAHFETYIHRLARLQTWF